MSQFISPMSYIYQIFPALLSIIGNVHECINHRYDNYKPNMHRCRLRGAGRNQLIYLPTG